jgi:molybdopterin molybdotransferase
VSGEPRTARSTGARSWPQARATAHTTASPLPGGQLPLSSCAGLTLAEPLRSLTPLPAADTAAMDGYAVAGEGPWQVVGRVLAGELRSSPLRPGQAVETATGAAVPVGTTAVLPVEDACVREGAVSGDVAAGRHLRRRGEECLAGEELLPAGTALGPAALGLAAACGSDVLVVRPRPRVAVLVTGTELLASGLPRDGRVRDSLGPQLRPLVAAYGGEVVDARHLVDDREQLARAVAGGGG